MGFKARRRLKLQFAEGHALHGLEITVRTITLGRFREITEREDKVDFGAAEIAAFVENVVEWNLEDEDGGVLPITADSFLTLDPEWSTEIRRVWLTRSMGQGVPDPLDEGSTSGSDSAPTLSSLAFAPTESLPTSPGS